MSLVGYYTPEPVAEPTEPTPTVGMTVNAPVVREVPWVGGGGGEWHGPFSTVL